MSTVVASNGLTLLDHARRIDPNGKIDKIAEIMTKKNEILMDLPYIESNMQGGHKTTLRTGLPAVTWRQINKGIQPTKSTTAQIEFTAGMMEAHGQVDEELVNLAVDKGALRLSENAPFIESISQTLASTLFYGDVTANPERFTGLTPYYSSTTADSYANVIKAGGVGSDNTSLWLVVWGENTIHGFYPKGTRAGIEHNDLGKMLIEDGITTGAKYMAFIDQYKAKAGLAVRDWRYAVRICNIDISDLATTGDTSDTSSNLMKYMVKATNLVQDLTSGKAAWYCNKDVKTALELKMLNKGNAWITMSDLENGRPVTKFLGIPVRRCDALVNNETLVS
jgi:hypothetical protein